MLLLQLQSDFFQPSIGDCFIQIGETKRGFQSCAKRTRSIWSKNWPAAKCTRTYDQKVSTVGRRDKARYTTGKSSCISKHAPETKCNCWQFRSSISRRSGTFWTFFREVVIFWPFDVFRRVANFRFLCSIREIVTSLFREFWKKYRIEMSKTPRHCRLQRAKTAKKTRNEI